MKYDEVIVVEGLRRGDPAAYKAMVSRFKNSLYVLAYTMLNNEQDAHDMVTHTFEDAFLKIGYYTPTSRFSTWLFSIAKHNCIDFIRTQRYRQMEVGFTPECLQMVAVGHSPEEMCIHNQQMEMVDRAVSKMKVKMRVAVKEFYFNGLHYHEIAEKYSVPSSTVRVRVKRARERLKELLTK